MKLLIIILVLTSCQSTKESTDMTLSEIILLCGIVQGPVIVDEPGLYESECGLTITNAREVGTISGTPDVGTEIIFAITQGWKGVAQVYVGGVLQHEAREPNAGYTYKETTDVGVYWHLRDKPWTLTTVLDAGGGALLDPDYDNRPIIGVFYTGNREYLDDVGEWFQDGNTIILRPNTFGVVEVVMKDFCIDVPLVDDVTIKGINLDKCWKGVRQVNSLNFTLEDVKMSNMVMGIETINVAPYDGNNLIKNNTFIDMEVEAISMIGVSGGVVTGNKIENVGMGSAYTLSRPAVTITGGVIAEYNTVKNAHYSGISGNASDGLIIRHNKIKNVCQKYGDCGAIYTSNAMNTLVHDNKIKNCANIMQGRLGGWNLGVGVYFDWGSDYSAAYDNQISGCDLDMHVNN